MRRRKNYGDDLGMLFACTGVLLFILLFLLIVLISG